MRALAASAVIGAAVLSSCGDPVTKGDIWDMEAADNAANCAKQYLGRPNSDPATEIWVMCTQIAAKQAKRPPVKVANRVIRNEGRNVFEPGDSVELSPAMVRRIESGS